MHMNLPVPTSNFSKKTIDVNDAKQICAAIDAFRLANRNRLPSRHSGRIAGTTDSWEALHCRLRHRKSTLASFISEQYPGAKALQLLFDFEQFRADIKTFRKLNQGAFPSQNSTFMVPGQTASWKNIEARLMGLGSSIAKFLDAEYPEERKVRRVDAYSGTKVDISNKAEFMCYVDAYREASEGRFPNSKSGFIPDTTDSWGNVDARLKYTGRTLATFIDECYPEARAGVDISNTVEVLKHVQAFQETNDGRAPNVTDGAIPNTGETWGNLNVRLRKAGSSLAAVIESRWPELRKRIDVENMDMFKHHVDAFMAANEGRYPTNKDGAIEGLADSWNAVGHRLRSRGTSLKEALDNLYPLRLRTGHHFGEPTKKGINHSSDGNQGQFPKAICGAIYK